MIFLNIFTAGSGSDIPAVFLKAVIIKTISKMLQGNYNS